jgi:hypothetical protein
MDTFALAVLIVMLIACGALLLSYVIVRAVMGDVSPQGDALQAECERSRRFFGG